MIMHEQVRKFLSNFDYWLNEQTAKLAQYFTLALKRDSKWSTGLSNDEEKELVNIEYKIIGMLSENPL